MKYLLRNALIRDPNSVHNNQVSNILIEGGKISSIDKQATLRGGKEIDCNGKWLSPSFIDLGAHFFDPGFEHKEDLLSGAEAAVRGGFGQVCVLSNTQPALDSKGSIEYIRSRSQIAALQILPIAAVSIGCEGQNMAEMHDLYSAGAVAFSDGTRPIINSELLLKALQYVQKFNGLVINRPADPYLSNHGQMHEGMMSTSLGMKGIPSIAEKLMIERDLSILEYTGGRIHFSCISTASAVELIREAKDKGEKVTCDVAIANLLFTDELLSDFDSNYKVAPALRTEHDRKALIEGLRDGTIDAIVSNHMPQDEESKKLEFDLAEFGMSFSQLFFSGLLRLDGELSFDKLLDAVTFRPRKILGLEDYSIEVGNDASLVILDPDIEWLFSKETNFSKSSNNPFFGQKMKGKCVGLIHQNKFFHEI